MSKTQTYVSWGAQIVAAGILVIALVPKFTGDAGSTAGMAIVVLMASLVVLYLRRQGLPLVDGG